LYDLLMRTTVSAARERLAEAIETAETEAVHLERYGVPVAVLISPARYEELLAAWEEAEDVAAFDEAMAEEGPNIPWSQVKADLGWTG
jgi:antitoxin Phd